jgi:hypothetical protein
MVDASLFSAGEAEEASAAFGRWPSDDEVAQAAIATGLSAVGLYFRGLTERQLQELMEQLPGGGDISVLIGGEPLKLTVPVTDFLQYSFPHVGPHALLYMALLRPMVDAMAANPNLPEPLRQMAVDRPMLLAVTVGMAVGVAWEIGQWLTQSGEFSLDDIAMNGAGYALAILLSHAFEALTGGKETHYIASALQQAGERIKEGLRLIDPREWYHQSMFEKGVEELLNPTTMATSDMWIELLVEHGDSRGRK